MAQKQINLKEIFLKHVDIDHTMGWEAWEHAEADVLEAMREACEQLLNEFRTRVTTFYFPDTDVSGSLLIDMKDVDSCILSVKNLLYETQ